MKVFADNLTAIYLKIAPWREPNWMAVHRGNR